MMYKGESVIETKIEEVVKKVVFENMKDVHSDNIISESLKKVSEILLDYFDIDIFSVVDKQI